MTKITVQNTDINIVKFNEEDYISLTDMARSQLQEHIIFRWLSLKSTIEYLGECMGRITKRFINDEVKRRERRLFIGSYERR